MTCYECQEQPGPGGMSFSDRSAVGICRHCGRGVCRDHGVWAEIVRELVCHGCAVSLRPEET